MKDRTILTENGDTAVLLFHAYTSTPNDFLSMSRELERQGYTVYAPTLSGHGLDNPDTLLAYDIEDWVEDGEAAYQFLVDKGYQKIVVGGLSLGGIVTNHLMLKHDLPRAMVFSAPTMGNEGSQVPANFEKWYRMKKYKQGFSKDEIERALPKMRDELRQVLGKLLNKIESMRDHYGEFNGNIFIGQGSNDEMIAPNQAIEYKKALVNASVTFKWYEEASHVITTGKVGKSLQKDVLEFLNERE